MKPLNSHTCLLGVWTEVTTWGKCWLYLPKLNNYAPYGQQFTQTRTQKRYGRRFTKAHDENIPTCIFCCPTPRKASNTYPQSDNHFCCPQQHRWLTNIMLSEKTDSFINRKNEFMVCVLAWAAIQNTIGYMVYKQQKYILHSSGSLCLRSSSWMAISCVSFSKDPNSIMKVPPYDLS